MDLEWKHCIWSSWVEPMEFEPFLVSGTHEDQVDRFEIKVDLPEQSICFFSPVISYPHSKDFDNLLRILHLTGLTALLGLACFVF